MKDDVLARLREDTAKVETIVEQHTTGPLRFKTLIDGRLVDTHAEDLEDMEKLRDSMKADTADIERS